MYDSLGLSPEGATEIAQDNEEIHKEGQFSPIQGGSGRYQAESNDVLLYTIVHRPREKSSGSNSPKTDWPPEPVGPAQAPEQEESEG